MAVEENHQLPTRMEIDWNDVDAPGCPQMISADIGWKSDGISMQLIVGIDIEETKIFNGYQPSV